MIPKLFMVSLAALAATAAASAGTSSARLSASSQCIAVQTKLGSSAFAQEFGSFGACVSALTPLARQNASAAVTLCRAERSSATFAKAHGGKTFARFYGTGHKLKNAYARCLAAKELIASRAGIAAAAACQAAQTDAAFAATHGGKTFAQYWGASAFANCLAQKATSPLTVDPVQPVEEPQQPQPQQPPIVKSGTAGSGTGAAACGPAETAGGLPRPLVCD